MTENVVPAGTWVQIRQQILPPGQRAPQVPQDTAQVPLLLVARGFLTESASLGQQVSIKTLSGRCISGELLEALPRYTHDFGEAVPELLEIGPRVREMLKGGENLD